jgi:4-amino-4-deoxy-L-arabinose transferase-like glycosyltransferase
MQKDGDVELKISTGFLKKKVFLVLLVLILIFGVYLRSYHLDYPVVGYHNWKETHYLTEARNFAEGGDWLTPRGDFPDLLSNPEGAHGDSLPITSWLTGIGFIIFGMHVWVGRLISILLVMGSILLMYLIVKKLFKREDLALTTALIAATNPLLVFFGRQIQLINPALFFAMLSVYLYLIWLDKDKIKYMFFAVFCFVLSFMTKYSFAIVAVPMLAIFPFKKLKKDNLRKEWKRYVSALLPLLLIPLWLLNNRRITSAYTSSLDAGKSLLGAVSFDISKILEPGFWVIAKSYIIDNYTMIGFLFAILGIFLFLFMYKNKKSKGYKFLFAYLIISIPWIIVMSEKLAGHSYHQYPIAPLIIILMAFCFVVLGVILERKTKIKNLRWVVIAILFILLIYPPIFNEGGGIFESKDRQFNLQFVGIDVAGDYIEGHSAPDERVFFSGHQSHGIVWEADRKGAGEHYNASLTEFGEEEFNFRWILVYSWGLEILSNPDKFDHIKEGYSLRQLGLTQIADGSHQPVYMLFEKGGSFDIDGLGEMVNEKQENNEILVKKYERTDGEIVLTYINFES